MGFDIVHIDATRGATHDYVAMIEFAVPAEGIATARQARSKGCGQSPHKRLKAAATITLIDRLVNGGSKCCYLGTKLYRAANTSRLQSVK